MTHKVLKSQIALMTFTPEEQKRGIMDFSSAVDNYATELLHWLDREAKIAAQAPLPPKPIPGDFKTPEEFAEAWRGWKAKQLKHIHPVRRPVAHPDVAAAVNNDGHVDFEVVNDDPTAEQVLRGKKNELLGQIHRAELEAIDRALPPLGKRRHANLHESDIHAADNAVRQALADEAVAKKSELDASDVEKAVLARRPKHHTQHLADQESRRAKVDAIVRAAAQVMSDVEDLTADNIGSFKIPAFGN
ncbi:hypothetical protein [Bradyrhizobium sp. CCGUVB14]|uniref:hypothetical protein n=1 Tax=Bradyrhizobium sp. CCGUVB14 TaxID=2949628 RepID=UPI0020B3B33D|nr:hypothetical protein [Bradyrhizobium sp. CCGUVB14]MCP3444591.1 hypothetical protein [Bradyrhizobium sp. CCGUVB14]